MNPAPADSAVGAAFRCIVCGGADASIWTWTRESADPQAAPALRGERRFPVVRCRDCGLACVWPRYSDEELRDLYADKRLFLGSTDPEGRQRSYLGEKELKQRAFAETARWLERYQRGGELLEIGCGPGFFLDVLGAHWRPCGIEWSPIAAGYARRELDLDVAEGAFAPGLYEAERFDAVAMLQVLDHLADPRQVLGEVGRILKPGGVLMLTSLVNGQSYCARVFGGGYRLLAPNHLYYFSPRTLRRILAETGFAVEQMRMPYWRTPYCNYRELNNLVWGTGRAVYRRWRGREPDVLSPPFYGNHLDVMARKLR